MINIKFRPMKKSVVVLVHFGFWLIIWFLLFTIMMLIPKFLPNEDYGSAPINQISIAFATITIVRLSIPFYLSFFYTKLIIKNIKYIIYPLVLIIPFYIILVLIEGTTDKYMVSLMTVVAIVLFASIGGLFQFFTDWFKKNQLKNELERKNHESTLALLRAQINPHFLFNTLHNIDTLIHDNQEKASKSLIRLSDIMRYMLLDTKSEKVSLEKELEHIENYVSLERLRFKNEKFLRFNVSGDFQGKDIAPMLFIPFVENAFKHSVDSEIENGIEISFTFKNNTLTFICENRFDEFEVEKDSTKGIGLETVKRRLNILYPNGHKLSIDRNNANFKVRLEITFNEN